MKFMTIITLVGITACLNASAPTAQPTKEIKKSFVQVRKARTRSDAKTIMRLIKESDELKKKADALTAQELAIDPKGDLGRNIITMDQSKRKGLSGKEGELSAILTQHQKISEDLKKIEKELSQKTEKVK